MQSKTEKVYYEEAGKGGSRRQSEIDLETFDNNWDRIFGKKNVPEQENKQTEKE